MNRECGSVVFARRGLARRAESDGLGPVRRGITAHGISRGQLMFTADAGMSNALPTAYLGSQPLSNGQADLSTEWS